MVDQNIWKIKLGAFLHDPPDKALKIGGHEKERSKWLLSNLGLSFDNKEWDVIKKADHIASAMQRINIPKGIDGITIDYSQKRPDRNPVILHTISGEKKQPRIENEVRSRGIDKLFISETVRKEHLDKLKDSDFRKMFFNVWRKLPELAVQYSDLPADTRIPDHTIWDHLDVSSGISPAVDKGLCLLSFKLTPVQEFIEKSRKSTDLWAGSHILSWLSFNAMLEVIKAFGPDSIIFPYLRRQPLMDWWLKEENLVSIGFDKEHLAMSNIPHRFLAIVPQDSANSIASKTEKQIATIWNEIAQFAKTEISNILKNELDGVFDSIWQRQIGNCFRAFTVTIPWAEPAEDVNSVIRWLENTYSLPKDLWSKYLNWLYWYYDKEAFNEEAKKIEKIGDYDANSGVLYGLYYEIAGRIINDKSRLFEYEEEPGEENGSNIARCGVCGVRNQLRTSSLDASHFWNRVYGATRNSNQEWILRKNERLCAVCLTRRFYREFFHKKFRQDEKVPSVASIATRFFRKSLVKESDLAAKFLSTILSIKTRKDLSLQKDEIMQLLEDEFEVDGELLYIESWTTKNAKEQFSQDIPEGKLKEVIKILKELYNKIGKSSKYYAIIMMDGDNMGKKLRGQCLPRMESFLHPAIKNELSRYEYYNDLLDANRILNPKIHMVISRSLKDFSTTIAPAVIRKYDGELIYSGGDDVLAFAPAETAFDATIDLNVSFGNDFENWNGKELTMLGKGSTMSAGIVFAHYNHPLHDALAKARESLESAKEDYGRNAFVLTLIKHSGQVTSAGGNWEIANDLKEIIKEFSNGLSTRFIYELMGRLMEIIEQLGDDAVKSEIRRVLKRHYGNDAKIEKIEITAERIISIYENVKLNRANEARDNGSSNEHKILLNIANLLKILHDSTKGDK